MVKSSRGYTIVILMFAIFIMGIGLMVAVPVWKTQLQREKEEELIFRGNQYVEAVRLFQLEYPGRFPESLEKLWKERLLRRLFKDPMTESGEWNLILAVEGAPRSQGISPPEQSSQPVVGAGAGGGTQKVLIAPPEALSSIANPQILGVVSRSTKKSIRIYHNQESYDLWLFYYGQDPEKLPEIITYGTDKKSS